MDLQVVSATIGPDFTLWIEQIVQNHYSHDLQHNYETTFNHNLQPNYTTIVLYNM